MREITPKNPSATPEGVFSQPSLQPRVDQPASIDLATTQLSPVIEKRLDVCQFIGRVEPKELNRFSLRTRILTARLGRAELYESLEVRDLKTLTGAVVASVDTSLPGMLVRDSKHQEKAFAIVQEIGPREMMRRIALAGEFFLDDPLNVGSLRFDAHEYCVLQSAVTGATVRDCRNNMAKVHRAMTGVRQLLETHLAEWRPDIALEDLRDESISGVRLRTNVLGAHLPSNSPGVHQLWVPFLTFVPLMLKPGSGDVFSPERIKNACIKAEIPREIISVYHGPGPEMGPSLRQACKLCMFFGGSPVQALYRGDRGVDLHGPGFSKVVLGRDFAPEWQRYLPLLERGITENAGRSCMNTSAIYAPAPYARFIAEALAEKLGPIMPKPLDDIDAQLAAFPSSTDAGAIYSKMLERCFKGGGRMFTDSFGPRVVIGDGFSFLRPTVAFFPSHSKYTATWEYLTPSVAVVEYDGETFPHSDVRTLVCTALTRDEPLLRSMRAAKISLLNEDSIPTTQLDPYRPIETNVVKFLFEQENSRH